LGLEWKTEVEIYCESGDDYDDDDDDDDELIFVRFFLSSSYDFHKSFVSHRDTTS